MYIAGLILDSVKKKIQKYADEMNLDTKDIESGFIFYLEKRFAELTTGTMFSHTVDLFGEYVQKFEEASLPTFAAPYPIQPGAGLLYSQKKRAIDVPVDCS